MQGLFGWNKPSKRMPPRHIQVLIRQKDSVGETFDVATYIGKTTEGEDRWICADVNIITKQISHWTYIIGPAGLKHG